MKVLYIDVNYKNSSTGKIVYDLFNNCNAAGIEAAVCYGRGRIIHEKNVYKFGINIETLIHALLTRLTGYTGCFSYFSTKRCINYIEKYKPDVIHIHELHAYFVNIVALIDYLKSKNIPIVWTQHCDFAFTGKCGYAFECEKWQTCCGECPSILNYPKSMFFDRTKKMFIEKKKSITGLNRLIITCPSKWVADRVKLSFLNIFPIVVVENGIDSNIFYPRQVEDTMNEKQFVNKRIILSIAPNLMDERKGGKHIIELANRLIDDKDLHFVMIGVKDANIKHPSNVTLLPKINNQDKLAEYYSLASMFVICSSGETFSLTCAEALSCGTRVAGFKSGAPEIIFAGENAEFCSYGDYDELIKLIYNGLSKGKVQKDSADIKRFSKNKMFEKYVQLYQSFF